jgi:TM2 domain-containing membrane protein YozV
LGRPGSGILYLLFFWTLIPAAIALIEVIILLFTDDFTFARKYPTGYA